MAIDLKLFKVGTDKAFKVGGSVAGYKPFFPTNISDNIIWLNNDPSTMTLSGANKVSQWSDSSGSGNHFTQGTGALQPEFVANGINGQNGILWLNSTTLHLSCTFATTYTQPYEIFTVWNLDVNSTASYPYVYDRVGSTGDRIQLYWFGNNIRVGATSIVTAYAKTRPFGLISNDVLYNGASTKVHENGVLQATVNTGAGNFQSMRLGHINGSDANSRFSGYICEVIAYSRELTTTERDNVNNYLSGKYGL